MINRSAGESAKVARLHAEYGGDATTFFFLLLAWLDVEGNVRAADWWLKGNVCPEVAGLQPGDCQRFARGLAAVGLAVPYEVAGKPYLHFPGFRDEQPNLRRDRERPEVPPFPQVVADSTLREVAGQPPGNLPATAGQLPARAAAEVEVEVEGRSSLRSEPATDLSPSQRALEGFSTLDLPEPAIDVLRGITHPGGVVATTRTLEQRFLYADGAGMPDQSVKGLPLEERRELVACALLEAGDQAQAKWGTPWFSGFVSRVRARGARPRENGRAPPEAPLTKAQHERYLAIRGELEDGGMEAEAAAPIAAERARREVLG